MEGFGFRGLPGAPRRSPDPRGPRRLPGARGPRRFSTFRRFFVDFRFCFARRRAHKRPPRRPAAAPLPLSRDQTSTFPRSRGRGRLAIPAIPLPGVSPCSDLARGPGPRPEDSIYCNCAELHLRSGEPVWPARREGSERPPDSRRGKNAREDKPPPPWHVRKAVSTTTCN